MKNTVLSIIGQRWRELVGFALIFRALESLIFAPVAAVTGRWLLGRTVLDGTVLVSFLLSPRGFLALLFAAVSALTMRLIEHAGLSAIFFGAFDGRKVSSREALRLVGRHSADAGARIRALCRLGTADTVACARSCRFIRGTPTAAA